MKSCKIVFKNKYSDYFANVGSEQGQVPASGHVPEHPAHRGGGLPY